MARETRPEPLLDECGPGIVPRSCDGAEAPPAAPSVRSRQRMALDLMILGGFGVAAAKAGLLPLYAFAASLVLWRAAIGRQNLSGGSPGW